MTTGTPLVILARDGVINSLPEDFVSSPAQWLPLPGALEAIAQLNHAGCTVVVVTNQPGLGRGLFDMATFNAIHQKMHKMLAEVNARVDSIFFCPHAEDEDCLCRKPLPGLLIQVGERYGVHLGDVPVVGERSTDVQAACAAGAQPHVLRTGGLPDAGVVLLEKGVLPKGTHIHDDLAMFVQHWLASARHRQGEIIR